MIYSLTATATDSTCLEAVKKMSYPSGTPLAEWYISEMLARFRSACGKFIESPWIVDFVDTLKNESKEFSLWWSLHDVEAEKELYKTVNHLILGELTFEHTSYLISEDTNLKLYINTPLASTDTGKKVTQLLELKF